MKIEIKEKPQTVKIVRNGVTHSGRWDDDGNVSNVKGDESLLQAVMTAWSGQKSPFELSDKEVEKYGGGWWAVKSSIIAEFDVIAEELDQQGLPQLASEIDELANSAYTTTKQKQEYKQGLIKLLDEIEHEVQEFQPKDKAGQIQTAIKNLRRQINRDFVEAAVKSKTKPTESPEAFKRRTGKCPVGYHTSDAGRCVKTNLKNSEHIKHEYHQTQKYILDKHGHHQANKSAPKYLKNRLARLGKKIHQS